MIGQSRGHRARPPRQSQHEKPSPNQLQREPSEHTSTLISPLVPFTQGQPLIGKCGTGGGGAFAGDRADGDDGADGGGVG